MLTTKKFSYLSYDNFTLSNLWLQSRKYGKFVKISYLFDKDNLLDYKSSPIDHGPDTFMELFRKRVNLYD